MNVMYAHSFEWLWDANVVKSNMLQIANGNIMTELSVKWGTEDIPYTEEAKNLGLWITKGLTWTKHMRAAKQKGYAALSKYRRLLQNNHVHMSVKTSVIKTQIIKSITYAMEVWQPHGPQEKKAFDELNAIVSEAMKLAVLGTRAYDWKARRCLTAAVLHEMLGVPTLESEMMAAHLRLAQKLQIRTKCNHSPVADSRPSEQDDNSEGDAHIPLSSADHALVTRGASLDTTQCKTNATHQNYTNSR